MPEVTYREANRRYRRGFIPAMVVYAIIVFAGAFGLKAIDNPPVWLSAIVAVVSVAPMAVVFWLMWRLMRETDEYARLQQALAMAAHPADAAGRHAHHQRIGGHIPIDDGAGANEGVFTHGVAADDGAIGPQGRAALDQRRLQFGHAGDLAPWIKHVREHHRRPAEHMIFERDAFID